MKKYLSGSTLFQHVVNFIMFIFLLIMLYPVIYVVSCSFSDPDAVNAGKVILWPVGFTLDGYKKIFENAEIWIGYTNTIFYTVLGTSVNLAVTIPAAYALSRKEVRGKNVLMLFFMITMYINGGLIPSYLNIRGMGLLNTRTLMVIMGALSVYNMIVAKTFFGNTIPYEITEAARIDGCSDMSILMKIVMPLSKAIIAVLTLYYGIGHWNSYFNAMIYLKDRDKFPLQIFLREILLLSKYEAEAFAGGSLSLEEIEAASEAAKNADLIKYCIIIVATLPMMLIYPKLQKYFEQGVMIGSVKG